MFSNRLIEKSEQKNGKTKGRKKSEREHLTKRGKVPKETDIFKKLHQMSSMFRVEMNKNEL